MKINRNFIFGIIWAVIAILLIVCSIAGFSAGSYGLAILWMSAGTIDGINAISNFCHWAKWKRNLLWQPPTNEF